MLHSVEVPDTNNNGKETLTFFYFAPKFHILLCFPVKLVKKYVYIVNIRTSASE